MTSAQLNFLCMSVRQISDKLRTIMVCREVRVRGNLFLPEPHTQSHILMSQYYEQESDNADVCIANNASLQS